MVVVKDIDAVMRFKFHRRGKPESQTEAGKTG